MVRVSVREHANIVRGRLIEQGQAAFNDLCIDCESTLEVVARFLALLELYRENLVDFEQVHALGELVVRWVGPDNPNVTIEVVPFRAGVLSGMQAPFVIYEFPDAADDDVLYQEIPSGDLLSRDDPEELLTFREYFERLREASCA